MAATAAMATGTQPHLTPASPSMPSSPSMSVAMPLAERKYALSSSESEGGVQLTKIAEEHSGRTVWHKTRSLEDNAIIETTFDAHDEPRWVCHRPLDRWSLTLFPVLPEEAHLKGLHAPRIPLVPHGAREDLALAFTLPRSRETFIMERTWHGAQQQHHRGHGGHEGSAARSHRQSWRASIASFAGMLPLPGARRTFHIRSLQTPAKVVVRYDETPHVLRVRTEGSLALSQADIDAFLNDGGEPVAEPSFWAAAAMTYLEYLVEAEAYKAASHG